VHDAVAGRNHVHVLEGLLGPVDEVEAVFVAAVFDGAVLFERLRVETTAFHGQRVVDDQLGRHHRVDQRGSPPLSAMASRRPARSTSAVWPRMSWHTTRAGTREVQVALAFDQLLERVGQQFRFAAAHQLLGQHARGVGQGGIGAGRNGVNGGAGVEVVQLAAGQSGAVVLFMASLKL
jgi:hypothetical protein